MFDTQEIYLSRLEQYEEEVVTCPHCESYQVVMQADKFTYTCLDCLNTFSVNPMADDPTIPF